MDEARTVTHLLRSWRAGDAGAGDELMPLVYAELRKIAGRVLRAERPGHTLRPTELVSEAYLKLFDGVQPEWNDRVHFFAVAARSMRRILVDHARARLASKRGDGERPVTFDEGLGALDRPEALVELDAALDALAAQDERKARVIEMHYFAGLTREEIGEVLAVHPNTVSRDLKLAQAWISRELRSDDDRVVT